MNGCRWIILCVALIYFIYSLFSFKINKYLTFFKNQISEEKSLLAVAAWPKLQDLIIHDNPLTLSNSGDPPVLKKLLQDRLRIHIQRSVWYSMWSIIWIFGSRSVFDSGWRNRASNLGASSPCMQKVDGAIVMKFRFSSFYFLRT